MAKNGKNGTKTRDADEAARAAVQKWAALVASTVSALLDSVLATRNQAQRSKALALRLNDWALAEVQHHLEDLCGSCLSLQDDNPMGLEIPSAGDMMEAG